ncbi:MAG: hypothetical protein V4726_09395 [Verrucomicrobiota bacterium]
MRRVLISLLSAGWLIPFWFSGATALSFLRLEIMPRLKGHEPVNSFPFEDFIQKTFSAACVWLGAAILFWAWRLSGFRKDRARVNE